MDINAVDIAIIGSVARVTILQPFSKTAIESVVETDRIMKWMTAVMKVMKIISQIPGTATFKIKNDSVLMIKKSLLTKNIGTGKGYNGGGRILNIGELNITESALTKNTAARGGAIKNESVMIITDSTLLNNRAGFGGAICLTDSKYESKECTFKDNIPDDVYEEKD